MNCLFIFIILFVFYFGLFCYGLVENEMYIDLENWKLLFVILILQCVITATKCTLMKSANN